MTKTSKTMNTPAKIITADYGDKNTVDTVFLVNRMIKNSEKYIFCHKYHYLMIRIDSVLIKNVAHSLHCSFLVQNITLYKKRPTAPFSSHRHA